MEIETKEGGGYQHRDTCGGQRKDETSDIKGDGETRKIQKMRSVDFMSTYKE